VAGSLEARPTVDFDREIRPILSENCFACHGPDEGPRKAGLRLDIREGILAEKDGVTAVVPGQSEASAVIQRVLSHDPDKVMPPPKNEAVVDRLLASPHYGERMAQMWLDLARFADSDGYHDDTPRSMWRFRDYVIHAFNANKPFDQFTVEQLAGDLLPHATVEQRMASAFHRNGLTSSTPFPASSSTSRIFKPITPHHAIIPSCVESRRDAPSVSPVDG
jgi:hypothetical protein